MATILSIGDILMLSQTAWKIGRAFSPSRRDTPPEFLDIELEINALATALKRLVEALYNENPDGGDVGTGDGTLARADNKTRVGMATILWSCRRTLQDLDSLVAQYQDTKTYMTSDGTTIKDKGWSDIVLRSYASMIWTVEGGTIMDLRSILSLHTGTLMLIVQSLQSKQVPRLERTVGLLAVRIDNIHYEDAGDLGERIDELHRIIVALAGDQSPDLAPQRDGSESIISSMDLNGSLKSRAPSIATLPSQPPPRNPARTISATNFSNPGSPLPFSFSAQQAQRRPTADRLLRLENLSLYDRPALTRQNVAGIGSTSDPSDAASRRPLSDSADSDVLGLDQPAIRSVPSELSLHSQLSSVRNSPTLRRKGMYGGGVSAEDLTDAFPERIPRESIFTSSSNRSFGSPWTAPESSANSVLNYDSTSVHGMRRHPTDPGNIGLGEPALPPYHPVRSATYAGVSPAYVKSPESVSGGSDSTNSARGQELDLQGKGLSQQQEEFERMAFRNTAIMCDVRGVLVEYTQPMERGRSRLDQELAQVCSACRILLTRSRTVLADGAVRIASSLWVFSDDGTVRMQQRLADGAEIIPYASFFTANKVSLPIQDSEIIFWGAVYGGEGEKRVKTNWINYVFHDADGSSRFQSLLFGRTLSHTFRTEKTLRVHEGMKGVLAYQEQLCAIELLRVWTDDIPDRRGRRGVLAMLHFSGQFRSGDGYLAFWLNSLDAPVRVKDDGGRWAKVKGLRIAVDPPLREIGGRTALVGTSIRKDSGGPLDDDNDGRGSRMSRRGSEKKESSAKFVTGARIEFQDESQKRAFLDIVKSSQGEWMRLPELAV